jgi:hypothetical protein
MGRGENIMDTKELIRQALIKKFAEAQDEAGIQQAQQAAGRQNDIASLGEALSIGAGADAVSRGARGTDLSSFDRMRQAAQDKIRSAVEARQGRIKAVDNEFDMQNQLEVGDRANRGLDLTEKNQTESNKLAREKFDADEAWRRGEPGRKAAELKAVAGDKAAKGEAERGDKNRKESLDLTDKYMGHPVTKETNTILSSYDKIKSVGKDVNKAVPADDMALVFSFMKMMDPGSTVREGEYANAENTRGVPESVRARYNKVLEGDLLTPQQRTEFIGTAGKIKDAQVGRQKEIYGQYKDISSRYGFDPMQVLGQEPSLPAPDVSTALQAPADQVKVIKGIQYKKVPGGWQKVQ